MKLILKIKNLSGYFKGMDLTFLQLQKESDWSQQLPQKHLKKSLWEKFYDFQTKETILNMNLKFKNLFKMRIKLELMLT